MSPAQEFVVVVAGAAHFGPFDSRSHAEEWLASPDRPVNTGRQHRIVPLFGGILLDRSTERTTS